MQPTKHPVLWSVFISAVGMLILTNYVFAKPNETIMSYPESSTEQNEDKNEQEHDDSSAQKKATSSKAASKASSKSSSSNSAKRSSSSSSSKKDSASREPVIIPPEDTLSKGDLFDDFVDDEESSELPSSSPSSSNPDTSTSSDSISQDTSSSKPDISSEDSSTSSNDEVTSDDDIDEEAFVDAIDKMNFMSRKYGVNIYANFLAVPDENAGEDFFTNESDLLIVIDKLELLLEKIDERTITALYRNSLPLEFFLVSTNSETTDAIETIIAEDCVQMVVQSSDANLERFFYTGLSAAFNEILFQNDKLIVMLEKYLSINPEDFTYGSYSPDYINSTPKNCYFLSSNSQKSIENDVANLFASDCMLMIPPQYLFEDCPILSKCDVIWKYYDVILKSGEIQKIN